MTSRCICFFELMATMAISQRSHGWMLIDSPITAVFSPNLKNLPTNYLNEPNCFVKNICGLDLEPQVFQVYDIA